MQQVWGKEKIFMILKGRYFEYSLRRNSFFRETFVYFVANGQHKKPTSQAVLWVVAFDDALQYLK